MLTQYIDMQHTSNHSRKTQVPERSPKSVDSTCNNSVESTELLQADLNCLNMIQGLVTVKMFCGLIAHETVLQPFSVQQNCSVQWNTICNAEFKSCLLVKHQAITPKQAFTILES